MKENLNPYISQNPFRTIGVLSNSGIKEIHKNLSKLKAYSQLGKKVDFDYDFNFLNLVEVERNNEIISKVESRILLDENKVKYSLFWFLDNSSFDSIAISNLIKGNTEKAIEIWVKATKSNEVTSKNYTAFNNLSTLLLFNSLEDNKSDKFNKSKDSIQNLRQALNYKCALISSNYFKDFCNDIGVTTDISVSEIQSFFATTILEIINKNFSNKELVELVDGIDESFASLVNSNLVKSPISNIKKNIKEASKDLTENEKNGIIIGKKLIKDSNKDLMYLKDTLGVGDYQYEEIADKLSNQILQCGIVCFNATKEDQEYLNSYKYALSIATSEKTKIRAEDSIRHCEEEKDANICKLCNINEVSKSQEGIRIKMYKMTSYNQYSYFKDGGLELKCCSSCKTKKSSNEFVAYLVFISIYAVSALLSQGVLLMIDLFLWFFVNRAGTFTIFSFVFRFIKKELYYNKLENHPLLISTLREGYKYGMPENS